MQFSPKLNPRKIIPPPKIKYDWMGVPKMGDPQVTMVFNTKYWSFMTWMIWGIPMTKETQSI